MQRRLGSIWHSKKRAIDIGTNPSKAQFAPARNGSFLLVHALDQISHAVRELGYFSLSLDVEIDCAVTRGSAINCFFQVQ